MNDKVKHSCVGRRKEAVARVILSPGTGTISVNGIPSDRYFIRETDRIIVRQPLVATNSVSKYDVSANLRGGGLTGQAGALRHGISRALISIDPELKDILRKHGYLTRDPRMKERKKYGQKGARKRFQWTKR
jgi:small subunit ribosomal protein S9